MNLRPADPTALGRGLRRRLRGSELALGGIVAEYLRPSLARLYAAAGYDFVYLETEHGFFYGPELTDFVLAARAAGLPAVAKVGELRRDEVSRLLDCGVCAVQLPRTESADQLAELADYAMYEPKGSRAGAPGYGNTDYALPVDHGAWLRKANQSVSLVAHIETRPGYENAAAIIGSGHADVVYVGPYDFSIAMGHPGEYDHPEVVEPMRHILQLCVQAGVCFGTTASRPETARAWIEAGARFFEMSTEIDLIAHGARSEVAAYRHEG